MKLFISRLRGLIDDNDMTQRDLADAIDVTEVTISRYLSGDRKPRVDIVNKIARYFNVSTDYLLEDFTSNKEVSDKTTTIKEETIPEYFDDPQQARKYIERHQIFGADGFELDDEEILEFANELLQQMKMVSYKYRK